jgi:hypothetical protein
MILCKHCGKEIIFNKFTGMWIHKNWTYGLQCSPHYNRIAEPKEVKP